MCDICNGKTIEQSLDDLRDAIRRVGWAVQGVEPSSGVPGWAYTVGLLTSYDHPELVIVDSDAGRGQGILNALGRAIRDGAIIEPGDELDLGGCRAELVDVHPDHLRNATLATWHSLHDTGPTADRLELEAYQLIALDPLASGERLPEVRLDLPGPALSGSGPNRAARRAARRGLRLL